MARKPKTPKIPRRGVYLLHFDRPISPYHTAQHYLGCSINIPRRLKQHATAPDAKMLQAAQQRGIGFVLARVWAGGDYATEIRLKRRGNGRRLCPICNPNAANLAANPDAGPRRRADEIPF